jgi:Holliday junction DNA helicase RuvB
MTDDPIPRCVPSALPEDTDRALRPQTLDDFIGQEEARANLRVFTESARLPGRGDGSRPVPWSPGPWQDDAGADHGARTGRELPHDERPGAGQGGDLAAILTNLDARDVLFIDEIHRLNPTVEEVLYPALEDFELDLVIGEGPAARTVRIELQPFTLIGATTRLGLLTTPLRDRFGIPTRLNFYTVEELDHIVRRGARLAGIEADPAGTMEIAGRARGTPRIAGRLLRRVIDFALVEGDGRLSRAIADAALTRLGVDKLGLDAADRRYLTLIAENYGGGPVGIETIAAALAEPRDALEEVIEPLPAAAGPDRAHAAGPDAGAERVAAPRTGCRSREGPIRLRSVLSGGENRQFSSSKGRNYEEQVETGVFPCTACCASRPMVWWQARISATALPSRSMSA